ncbi:hypothetical protein LCGC14_2896190, partial [marine sediment metagenome]
LSFTYDELIAAIQTWLEEGSLEFSGDLPILVKLGESRLATDLNFEIFDVVVGGALTSGQFAQAIKPANWQGTRSIHLRDSGGGGLRRFLERRSYEWCLDFEPDETATAEPKYYAEFTETDFFVVPPPDIAYGFELRQIQTPDALAPGNQNTWLGDNAGDLLLYACLLASDEFLISDPSDIDTWRQSYGELMPARKIELRRQWRGDYDPVKSAATTVSMAG